ncbi:c-type cytochrome [Chlorobium phaeobacteroides]|uniref:Cytochrome c, class I n=1 Tax=Chlorobium phaeobacteroides (strain DSM 266 / SMG 266 / 2430) TaxID=290317 RepID=A1BCU1_CHLPD|nr:c-type cytochrome [Chlorobium phaeobacteroides]ABL64218.1 cytochrome c, class I [Chlorobium phaeobacteroides DSM 266]
MKTNNAGLRPFARAVLIGSAMISGMLTGCSEKKTVETPPKEPEKTVAASNESPLKGLRLYLGYCFICHGQTGRGDGPYAASLTAKPADLTNRGYFSARTDQQIYDFISKGGIAHGKSIHMRPFGMQLTRQQIMGLVSYVRVLNEGRTVDLEKSSGNTADDIYGMSCIMCHGSDGNGDGEIARKLNIAIRPLGSKAVQDMSDQQLYAIISGGITDTARVNASYMPAWSNSLTKEQIDELVAYIRELGKP